MARVVGRVVFSMRVQLEADLPEPPYVIAANHFSHLDPVAVGGAVGSPDSVSRSR